MSQKLIKTSTEGLEDYLEGNPVWVVKLNDGTTVYRYDHPDVGNSWENLFYYCKENSLYIVEFSIGFRDNFQSLPSNKDGYFFRRMARGSFSGSVMQFFLVGYIDKDSVKVYKYKVPEITLDSEEVRSIEESDISLIRKNDV